MIDHRLAILLWLLGLLLVALAMFYGFAARLADILWLKRRWLGALGLGVFMAFAFPLTVAQFALLGAWKYDWLLWGVAGVIGGAVAMHGAVQFDDRRDWGNFTLRYGVSSLMGILVLLILFHDVWQVTLLGSVELVIALYIIAVIDAYTHQMPAAQRHGMVFTLAFAGGLLVTMPAWIPLLHLRIG